MEGYRAVQPRPHREKFPGGTKVDTWPPKPYRGLMPLNHFCPMGVGFHLKVRG